ncbi:MAG TPA: TetR/AcrR family transcriptional regulator [Actinomycetota bacterium]
MVLVKRKRTIKSPEHRRDDLLNAAVKVFAEKGIAGATIADVAEAAGVAKGTFYLYFSSKEHLLASLRERFVSEIMAHAASYLDRFGREDWWELADAVIEGWIDFDLEHRDVLYVFTKEGLTPETQETFAECERRLTEMMALGIQGGRDSGTFSATDPMFTATFIKHAIEGAVLESILNGQEIDRDRLVAGAKELVRKVLSP